MGKNIDLNSSEWRDIVFDGKNKAYGAYQLRKSSSKRHIVAFLVTVVFVGIVAAIPAFLDAVKSENDNLGGVDAAFEMSDLNKPEETKQEDLIRQELAPPPPPVKASIQFTPPAIVEDSKVNEEKEMKTIEELKESKVQISIATVEGSNDKNAVDIAELKEHKQVVEDKEPEKPFQSVEQPPQFPGGDAELMKFLNTGIKYPAVAAENGIQGQVVLRFVVDKDGHISNVEVLKTLDASCDREAIRVVKSMPRWIPGKQNGRNVPVYYTLPVRFRLQ